MTHGSQCRSRGIAISEPLGSGYFVAYDRTYCVVYKISEFHNSVFGTAFWA